METEIITGSLPHFDTLLADAHISKINRERKSQTLEIGISEDLEKIKLSIGDSTIYVLPELARKYANILNSMADGIDSPA